MRTRGEKRQATVPAVMRWRRGALSGPDGPAPAYLGMMRRNATTLAQALGSQGHGR